MKIQIVLLKSVGILLSVQLVLPASAYALRPLNAGAEESPTQAKLTESLAGTGVEQASEIIRQLRLVSDADRPAEEIVRDFIRQLEAGDAHRAPEAWVNRLTAHRKYVAGFRLNEVEGRPEEGALLEALLADSRRVLEHAGGQIGLTPQEAEQQLGWETIRRLGTALYTARDQQGRLLLAEVHAETLARWFYRELPRRLVPLLAEPHRAELARTGALENPFREGNRRSNTVLADLVEARVAAGTLIDDPERLQKEPDLIKPWIRLLLASNLVDYSKPGLFQELARQPGKTEEERLGSYIEQYEKTPFLWRERNERDLDRYLHDVVYSSPRLGRNHLLEVVLADNNGEMVLTLKLAELKLAANPHLRVHLILKGDNGVMNDASVEDARELMAARPKLYALLLEYQRAGRFRILRGPASHGIPLDRIHPRVARSLLRADAVFVEGEANTVMANGLNADLYLALRLKHPLVVGPIFGLDQDSVIDNPPAFLHVDGRLGHYYGNSFAPLSTGQRLTIAETWARPVRLEVTVPAGEPVEVTLPTGEVVLLKFRKGKVVVSVFPDETGGLPFFTHRERSLRHGAVWNNTLLKTLRALPAVQAGRKRERAVEEGVYFFPLPLLTQQLLPLETVRRLTQEGWTPWEISQRLIWDGATPERWRAAAPYVFWDRGHVLSKGGKEVVGELIEIRYQEPVELPYAVSAGAEETAVEHSLAIGREVIQGPGVVVIDAAMFPKQTGMEEFLKRLSVEGRFIVVGAESAAGLEAHARNPAVILAAGPVDAATAILVLPARGKVYVFGGMDLTRLLQLYLRDFLIEVSPLDLRLGLKGILLALGVPEDVLQQLDWESVDSALSSLEAA